MTDYKKIIKQLQKDLKQSQTENKQLKREMRQLKRENKKLETELVEEKSPMTIFKDTLKEKFNDQYNKDAFNDCEYKIVNTLKPEYAGQLGEDFINNICKECKIPKNHAKKKNTEDGTYDMKIKGKRVEIKTARLGTKGRWQHETLRNEGCDFYLFLDIHPENIYLSLLKKFDLSKEIDFIRVYKDTKRERGKKATLRKGATDVFKLDLSIKEMKQLVEQKKTFVINKKTSFEEINKFIVEKLKQ